MARTEAGRLLATIPTIKAPQVRIVTRKFSMMKRNI